MANEKKVITLDNLADFKQRYDQTVDAKLAGKQDNLIAGDHITIENNVISAVYVAPSVMTFKGTVQTYADLPATGNDQGDVWNVAENGDNYVWTGTEWDKFSSDVDLSNYVTTNTPQDITAQKTIRTSQYNNGMSLSTPEMNKLTITAKNSGSASIKIQSQNTGSAELSASSVNQLVFNKGEGGVGGISSSFSFPDGRTGETIATTADISQNIGDGVGVNAVQQKTPDASIDFTGRNPNAEALDPTLSATINTGASGNQSASIGKDTIALGINSFTNGNKTIAKGEESHAEGYQSVALGDGAHAEGTATTAYSEASHSEGSGTVAYGLYSHSEGVNNWSKGESSHAEGNDNESNGYGSHVEGAHTYTGDEENVPSSRPEDTSGGGSGGSGGDGGSSTANKQGNGAHAEGFYTVAVGNYSHSEGYVSDAIGLGSHAEGGWNTASGELSHAEGKHNTASGYCSHVAGLYNIAGNAYQTVIGRYNLNKTNTVFEIGWGESESDRKNIFDVYEDGHAEVGLMGSTNLSVATKQYVDAVRTIAEGKCKTYILSYAQTTPLQTTGFYEMDGTYHDYSELDSYISGYVNGNGLFNSQSDAFTISGTTGVIQKTYYILKRADLNSGTSPVIALSDTMSAYLKTGDIFLVIETDVPDRWFGYTAAGVAYKLETSKIDLSNYLTTNTAQDVYAQKTIMYPYVFLMQSNWTNYFTQLSASEQGALNVAVKPAIGNATIRYKLGGDAFTPESGSISLGSSSKKWTNVFMSGVLSDGTNSVTVAHLAQNTPTQWYGTQAQYDALGTYDSNTIYNILES